LRIGVDSTQQEIALMDLPHGLLEFMSKHTLMVPEIDEINDEMMLSSSRTVVIIVLRLRRVHWLLVISGLKRYKNSVIACSATDLYRNIDFMIEKLFLDTLADPRNFQTDGSNSSC